MYVFLPMHICSGCMKIIALQLKAVENETGLEGNPLILTWPSGKPSGILTEGSFTPGVSNTEDISESTPNFTGLTSSMATGMPSFGFDSSKVILTAGCLLLIIHNDFVFVEIHH